MSNSTEERIAARKAAEESLRLNLAALEFDGPHAIETGDIFSSSSIFGGGRFRYAICLRCGAMVKLDDPIERDGKTLERGIPLHVAFHETKRKR